MKSVLISIHPKWCELIAIGKKTVEVRKTRPKIETPFKCYIYCTNSKEKLWVLKETERAFTPEKIDYIYSAKDVGGTYKANGKVIGEFICDDLLAIENLKSSFRVKEDEEGECRLTNITAKASCMWFSDMKAYLGDKDGYGWHISYLKIYDKPRKLSEFGSLIRVRDWERGTEHFWKNGRWYNPLKRPPQSWCYVEELL